MRFILASSSPRRREIISEMVTNFEIIKPNIDETQDPDEAPFAYVRRLSQEKANAVAAQIQSDDATILAADTVVILAADTIGIEADGEILGKPVDGADASAILKRLRNRPHHVCTAFTLMRDGYQHTEVVTTTVHMRDYSDDEIEAYIATGDPFDKAGSYAIQHEGFHPVREIEGSYSNVVGLPADEVRRALILLDVPIKNAAYRVKYLQHYIVDFNPTDDPLSLDLDPHLAFSFVIAAVRYQGQWLLHYNPERKRWAFAGGSIENGEHPQAAAQRVLLEETGQKAEHLVCRGVLKLHFVPDDDMQYAALYVGDVDEMLPFMPNEDSAAILLWDGESAIDGLLSQLSFGVMRYS